MIYAVNKRTKEHRLAEIMPLENTDWMAVQATPDGWIEWHGGECPLPDDCFVQIKTNIGIPNEGRADEFRWVRQSRHGDIIAYRPILDADTKPEPPAWNGEGLPPVGCECEVNHLGEWHETTIVGYDAGFPVFNTNWHERYAYASGSDFKFRPIRSEEDRAVEEMARDIRHNAGDSLFDDEPLMLAEALYRAGYRKESS